MTSETAQRDPAFVRTIQQILDQSAATATPEVGAVFARNDWRFSAEQFLDMWAAVHNCTVASVGPKGQPHIAVVHADFQPDGRLTMRMYDGSVRAKDVAQNSRIALSKYSPQGAVAMIYGRARVVPGTSEARSGLRSTSEVEIAITRIYAMQPKR